MAEPLLDVRGLHVRFADGAHAVRGVDLQMAPGEVLGLVGESGAGKSALVSGVVGLLPRGATLTGSVRLAGTELVGLDDRRLAALRGPGVAMVFQDPLSVLNPLRRVGTLVAEALRLHDRTVTTHAVQTRVDELFTLVGLPAGTQQAFAHELSGGMRQRVGIAIAIACSPRLLVADEPTTALDVAVQVQVLEVLDTARQTADAGLLLVSHDLGVVAGWADRVAVMYAGHVVEQAPTTDLFAAPRMPYTIGLLRAVPDPRAARRLVPVPGEPPTAGWSGPGCAFAPRCPVAQPRCAQERPRLGGDQQALPAHLAACWRADELVGGTLSLDDVFAVGAPRDRERPVPGDPVLEICDLRLTYRLDAGVRRRGRRGQIVAVDSVWLTVRRGEIVALVGESGAGKTSTVERIFEAVPALGTVRLLGHDLARTGRSVRRRLRRSVQLVAQDATDALDPRMTVRATVGEPLLLARVRRPERHRRVAAALRTVGLHPTVADAYPYQLSGGQRRRVAVARALVTDPELVVLDEPVAGLDVSVAAGLLELLADLRDSRGLTALVVTHDLAVVRQLADRVAVMAVGRVVEEAPTAALFTAPAHPCTQALLAAVPVPDPTADRPRAVFRPEPEWASAPTGPATPQCRLAPRCPLFAGLTPDRQHRCRTEVPRLLPSTADRTVACHWWRTVVPSG
ncbi:MAG: ABC transporter ATP-binding protein [Micrococcales bacterium]|nr:ABC transporter ATP-binding protein [Micrococcales bacterium]